VLPIFMPKLLKMGDKIRFVSPASTPERERVEKAAEILISWGFEVDFGAHAFDVFHYFAGTDEQRLADFNDAVRDPKVRAIFATRGGAGSYRIVDGVDYAAARHDPKILVGFSDITILHLAMWKHGIGGGLHGALRSEDMDVSAERPSLYSLLTDAASLILRPAEGEDTAVLTTSRRAEGILLGGNLDILGTAAGWMLPKLAGSILLLEAIGGKGKGPGELDRKLTMLRQAGHFNGVVGVAVGQFTEFKDVPLVVSILRDHLSRLGVPILGGLPVGHRKTAWTVPLGRHAVLDADAGTLTVAGA
jgi:muramoyltetrapeptide carboxypeptidase